MADGNGHLLRAVASYTPEEGKALNLGPASKTLHRQLEEMLHDYKVARSTDAARGGHHRVVRVELELRVVGEKG
jgi:hypothetical protein